MLDVIYEDNHIIVVIKPQNIPSQKDETGDMDMNSMVKDYLKEKYNKPGEAYVGLVHRLDRPTGGIMVFAKTGKASTRLSEQIKNKEFTKTYLAVVVGSPKEDRGHLTNYLKKNSKTNTVIVVPQLTTGAKLAELDYEVLVRNEKTSLIKVNLLTGRSHQIRVQMKHINCPIFGDVKYGGDTLAKGHNLALWAYNLKFEHPTTKNIMNFKVYPDPKIVPWSTYNLSIY